MTRIAVIGGGAIGSIIATRLCVSTDADIHLCVRSGGFSTLRVEGPDGIVSATPAVHSSPRDVTGQFDWVITTTKAYDSASVAKSWLPHLLGSTTRVAVLQNGVEQVENFAAFLPTDRILPVMLDIPAERMGPGHVRQRRPGLMVLPQVPGAVDFASLFLRTGITVQVDPDFRTVVWRKLCLNAAGAVSVLLNEPAGIVHQPGAASVMRSLIAECVAVARAEGAVLNDATIDEVMRACMEAPRDGVNSMLADRQAGRPLELEARNGVIIRRGRVHSIPTPVNQVVYDLITAAVASEHARSGTADV